MKSHNILFLFLTTFGITHAKNQVSIEKKYRLYYQGINSWNTPPPETLWWTQQKPAGPHKIHKSKKEAAKYKAMFISPRYLTLTYRNGKTEYRPTGEYRKQVVHFEGTTTDQTDPGWRGMLASQHAQNKRKLIAGKLPAYATKEWVHKLQISFYNRYGLAKKST